MDITMALRLRTWENQNARSRNLTSFFCVMSLQIQSYPINPILPRYFRLSYSALVWAWCEARFLKCYFQTKPTELRMRMYVGSQNQYFRSVSPAPQNQLITPLRNTVVPAWKNPLALVLHWGERIILYMGRDHVPTILYKNYIWCDQPNIYLTSMDLLSECDCTTPSSFLS